MKYFIDFEATQFSHEIISIGCVREDGETFKSFVYVKPSKMSGFITRLTNITKDDVRNAPSSDEVFSNFYNWINTDNNAVFYCYGDSDTTFIESNLKKTVATKANVALNYIHNNLIDFSNEVKNYFGLIKQISLKKLVAYYRGVEDINQTHDALEDSLFLKEVYEHMTSEEAKSDAFPEYKNATAAVTEKNRQKNNNNNKNKNKKRAITTEVNIEEDKKPIGLIRMQKNETNIWKCDDLYTATMRCIRKKRQRNPELQMSQELYKNTRKGILEAIKNGTKYEHYFWAIKKQ